MTKATEGLAALRVPFPDNQISKLPKPYKKDSAKGNCSVCGGYHGLPAVHLDYVGHAALTDRLLDVDPEWFWEPLAYGDDGLPALDRNGGLWIKLTVLGTTRLGYGSADGKVGGNAVKELIGDALRNAAMRFGAALDLWHKGELHVDEEALIDDAQLTMLQTYASGGIIDAARFCAHSQIGSLKDLPAAQFDEAIRMANAKVAKHKPTAIAQPRPMADAGDIIDSDVPY